MSSLYFFKSVGVLFLMVGVWLTFLTLAILISFKKVEFNSDLELWDMFQISRGFVALLTIFIYGELVGLKSFLSLA